MLTPARTPMVLASARTMTPEGAEPTWRGEAECRRTSAVHFFPPPHFEVKEEKDEREDRARALCSSCRVQQACLDYALAVQEPHGIWGGLNELERRRLIRKRAAAAEESRSA